MVVALERSLAVLPETLPSTKPTIPLHPEMVRLGMQVNVEVRDDITLKGVIDHHLGDTYFKLVCSENPPKYRAQLINAARQNVYQAFVK